MQLPEGVTEADVAKALTEGQRYAKRRARNSAKLAEVAGDAVTDALVWSIQVFDPSRGVRFSSFVSKAVERFVWRKIGQSAKRFHEGPTHCELNENIPAPKRALVGGDGTGLSLDARELPGDLRDTVRFFYVDRFDVRECAMLLGCSSETIRDRLRRAAKALAGDDCDVQRVRKAGEKRVTH